MLLSDFFLARNKEKSSPPTTSSIAMYRKSGSWPQKFASSHRCLYEKYLVRAQSSGTQESSWLMINQPTMGFIILSQLFESWKVSMTRITKGELIPEILQDLSKETHLQGGSGQKTLSFCQVDQHKIPGIPMFGEVYPTTVRGSFQTWAHHKRLVDQVTLIFRIWESLSVPKLTGFYYHLLTLQTQRCCHNSQLEDSSSHFTKLSCPCHRPNNFADAMTPW